VLPLRTFSRFALTVAVLLAALLAYAVGGIRSAWASHLASEAMQAAILLWAAMCATIVARRSSGHLRQLWSLFASSLWLLAAAQATVTYLSSFTRASPATPWPSDVLNFIWVVPAIMMLPPYGGARGKGVNWPRTLDFIQAAIVALTAYLYFFYAPSLWEAEGEHMFHRLMVGMVSRDVLLTGCFGVRALLTRPSPARGFFACITLFFTAVTVSELITVGQLGQSGPANLWADAAWSVPHLFAIFLAASWNTRQQPDPESPRPRPAGWVASQVFPVCIPLVVILMGHRIALEQLTLAWIAVGASFACSAARLVITSAQQHRIADALGRAEQALRASEQMFSSAFRASPDAISIALVPEGLIQEVNASFVRLTGFSREEAVGKSPEALGLWVDEDQMRALRARFRETGELQEAELRFRRQDGEVRHGLLSGAIIDLNGRRFSLVVVRDVTESKQAEVALRASEERFRSLVHSLRVGVSAWSPDGRCRFVNRSLMEMTGLAENQFLGKTTAELGPAFGEDGTEIPPTLRPAARVKATRQAVHNQVLGLMPPGAKEIIWTLMDAVPEFTPDGELAGIIASYTDITDLKRAEKQMRTSQEMFFKAFHASPDAMTISTLAEGRYLEVNEGYCRLFGWHRDEVVGRTTLELGVWPDSATRGPLRRALEQNGRVRQMEIQLGTKTGELRTFLISADVIEINGQACLLAVSDDITDRKQEQEALRFSEERFRTLVHSLDVGVVLIGADSRIQFANPAALHMFRLASESVLGKTVAELSLQAIREDGSPVPDFARPSEQVLATGQPIRDFVLGFALPDSEQPLWVFGNIVPLFSEDGKIAGVVAAFANITEQKKAGEALRQLSGRLLRLQDEERRRLGRDLHDSLAQSVLAVNLSLAQVSQSSPDLDDRNRRALTGARVLLQDMSRQIRTLSYLLHPPLLDELGLASAVKEYAHGFSERSGIQIQVGVSPGFGRLPQETETALFRVIQESLANIQRHSGSPSARIRLDGNPDRITLEITDQGHGIPEPKGKKLNQAGARIGVGIAGMRERMAQLGGTLEIESGKSGTTVRATLPVKAEVLDAASRSRGG